MNTSQSDTLRIALISDIHANATAFEAVLRALSEAGIQEIMNLGDSIAIGPDPERVIGMLIAKRIPSLCGNHEQYFLEGTKAFPQMDESEKRHQDWIREQLAEPFIPVVSDFPLQHVIFTHGRQINFLHYAMKKNESEQLRFVSPMLPQDLQTMRFLFGSEATPKGITCFGHQHEPCYIYDQENDHHYINPGSLGCHSESLARYAILDIREGDIDVHLHAIPYNKNLVMERLFSRDVPERDFIVKAFYT